MIFRSVGHRFDADSIELRSRSEHAGADILHLEIWPCLLLVKVELFLSHALRVICPVPRLDAAALRNEPFSGILVHGGLQVNEFLACLGDGRSDDCLKERINCLRISGHLVREDERSRSVVAEKPGLFLTETENLHY